MGRNAELPGASPLVPIGGSERPDTPSSLDDRLRPAATGRLYSRPHRSSIAALGRNTEPPQANFLNTN